MTIRGSVGALVLFCLPLAAAAQRIEVAVLVSGYKPLPGVQRFSERIVCDDPCPLFVQHRFSWGSGVLVGGRFSLQLDPRFGFDATIQRVRVTNQRSYEWGTDTGSEFDDVAATFVAVQPHVRLRVADSVQVAIAVGPVIGVTRTSTPQGTRPADPRLGIALSAALRMLIGGPLHLELRASDYVYLEPVGFLPRNVHDLTYGVGLVLGFNRRPT